MRNLVLYGPQGWAELMKEWAQRQSLNPIASFVCFDQQQELAEFLNTSTNESVVLFAGSISEPLLENVNPVSPVLVVFGCNLSSILAASIFSEMVDTLEELEKTIVSQSQAAVSAEIENPSKR